LREYNAVPKLKPRSKGLILKLGNLFRQNGDAARAREYFRKYLKFDSLGYDAKQIQLLMGT
jgi:lipopolysaccharide biosynthesis regulator YciM